MKVYFLVHGRDGSCTKDFFPRLKNAVETQGNKVICCEMPHTQSPEIARWVSALGQYVDSVLDNEMYFIGHSIGCQTILRYLQNTSKNINGCFFIAPWFDLISDCITDKESQEIVQPWIHIPIDLEGIKKKNVPITALFSDDDYCVSIEQAKEFETKLDAKTYVFKNKGHFTADDGVDTLPEILTLLPYA